MRNTAKAAGAVILTVMASAWSAAGCSDDDGQACGNGVKEGAEVCDGSDLDNTTCQDLGFSGGTLACNENCTGFVTAGCDSGNCGNGTVDTGESCDGTDLGGATCHSLGHAPGTLGCDSNCEYVITGCGSGPVCPSDEQVSLSSGQAVALYADTANEDDTADVSCESTAGTADRVTAITVDGSGTLAVTSFGDWHVFALFEAPDSAADCFSASDELGCSDPYFDGSYVVFSGLQAGTYYLVVADYDDSASLDVDYQVAFYAGSEVCNNGEDDDDDGDVDCDDTECSGAVYCTAEICDNGTDDNLDYLTDCADFTCVGTAACTGGVCAADTDLGVITDTPDATQLVTADTSSANDNVTLPCNPAGGGEHVVQFTLGRRAWVGMEFSQAADGDNYLGFFLEGPSGGSCIDAEYYCFEASGSTDFLGPISSDPLPPGDYWYIIEANGPSGGGPLELILRVLIDYCHEDPCTGEAHATGDCINEPLGAVCMCDIGYVWNGQSGNCEAYTCQATDLGTLTGSPITRTGDSCNGTTDYGKSGLSCTGFSAKAQELVYSVTVPNGSSIDVTLTPTGDNDQDSSLYLLADCGDLWGVNCLSGADDTMLGQAENLSWTNNTGGETTVYIVADSYYGCGPIELAVQ